jgi:hypothetical protein
MQQGPAQAGAQAKAPISAHPAFPLIVGLWFAALLGLGTIVLPAVVLEKAAGVTGLSSVFPQAGEPLTLSARAAFALLAAILGLVGGLTLARRVVETQVISRPPRRRAPNAPPRPLSVHDDLGEEAIVSGVDERRKPLPGRRRALAPTEDERLSDFLPAAPLPGADTHSPPPLPTDEDAMSERPGDIEFPAHEETPEQLDVSEPYVPALDTRKPREFAPPPQPEATEEREPLSLEPIDAPLEDLGIVQLAERLGRSMHRRLIESKPRPEESEADVLAVPPPVVPDALRAFMDCPPEDFAPQPAAAEEVSVEVPAPVIPAVLPSFAFGAYDADEDEDDDGIADESCSSLLSMNNPFRPTEEFVRIDEPDEPEDEDDDAIEPVVVFPSQEPAATESDSAEELATAPNVARPFDAPHEPVPSTAPARPRAAPDPVGTERALRSALANLQRMSGAA